MPDMLEGRYCHAAISIENKLYLVGGANTDECEVFDTISQKFAYIKPIFPTYNYHRFQPQCVAMGNKIKIINNGRIAVYDIDKEDWYKEKVLVLKIDTSGYFLC